MRSRLTPAVKLLSRRSFPTARPAGTVLTEVHLADDASARWLCSRTGDFRSSVSSAGPETSAPDRLCYSSGQRSPVGAGGVSWQDADISRGRRCRSRT